MSGASRRVVITGVGLISPLGNSKEQLWEGLSSGRSGVRPLESVPGEALTIGYGAEAREFTGAIEQFGPLEKKLKRTIKKGLKVMCREIQMGVAAAQLALADAQLEAGGYDPDRTGVVYGSDYIMTAPGEFTDGVRRCLDDEGRFHFEQWAESGLPKVDPLWLLKYLPNMPASHIAIYNDLRGPNNSLTMREASANLAIGEAFCTIARGGADRLLVGATGTRVHPLRSVHVVLQEELAANNGDPGRMSRPFDLGRTGLVMGEGAGAIILEELETAEARGAEILGEVVGFGSSTVLNRRGAAQYGAAVANVLRQTLRSADLQPADIGHVHAHGLSTRRADAQEAQAIHDVFGEAKSAPPVTAAKSYFGNLGAGGGMVELIASTLALGRGSLPAVLNYETPDPECPVNIARDNTLPAGDSFVNLNFSPQGQAGCVAVRKWS